MNNLRYLYMKHFFLLFTLFAVISSVLGQNASNLGLTLQQAPATLPQSKVPVVRPVQKPKVAAVTLLKQVQVNDFLLTGGWELAESSTVIAADRSLFSPDLNTGNWYNATVPGTVLTTLVNQGVYPDPYYGVNNLVIPESLCRTDWWYRIVFRLPEGNNYKNTWLLFNGINYKADIWLNGKQLGKIEGAFQRGKFNATDLIHGGKGNILAVHILPPPNPGIPHEESPRAGTGPNGGQLCLDGPTFISSEGWDWVPGIRDRNIGIWQDVHLRFTDDASILDPQVITDLPLPDTTSVNLTVRIGLRNTSDKEQQFTVNGKIENIVFRKQVNLKAGEQANLVSVSYTHLTLPTIYSV